MSKLKKWTKKDIGTMTGILDSVWLQERMYYPADMIRGAIETQRKRLVTSGLQSHVRVSENRARESREAALHFQTTGVYGTSTEEMAARFVGYAEEEERALLKLRALLAHVEAEGLPEEVSTYLPAALRPRV